MSDPSLVPVLRHVRGLAGLPAGDAELLERFVGQRDPAAFEALLRRHGPLVWRVCRRLLRHEQAEDVFQATWLVFARRAASIRKPGSLSCWLHGVAHRLAGRARKQGRRRAALPAPPPPADPAREAAWRELGEAVEQELGGLPERFRAPLLLCYWEGATNEEAARRLGLPTGTLKTRLARARELLRARLVRRGVTLPAGVIVTLLAPAGAEVPAATLRAALRLGQPAGAPARVVALAEGASGLSAGKAKAGLALLLATALVAWAVAPAAKAPEAEAAPKVVRPAPHGEPLPAGALVRLGDERFRLGGGCGELSFLPDGKVLTSIGSGGTVCWWDAATGKLLRRLAPGKDRPEACALSRDGGTVAWAEAGGAIRVRAVSSGRERVLAGHRGGATSLVFAPDGKSLYSAGPDGKIRAWSLATGAELWKARARPGRRIYLALSPDGKVLASSEDGLLRLWDAPTGRKAREWDRGEEHARELTFSPDGKLLAFVASVVKVADSVCVLEVATGKETTCLGHPGSLYGLTFSPDGQTLAVATVSGTVRRHRVATGAEAPPLRCHHGRALSVAYSRDGKVLATSDEWCVRLWDAASGREVLPLRGHLGNVRSLALFPDGRAAATAGEDHTVCLWHLGSGRLLRRLEGHEGPVYSVRVSPDGLALASAGYDGKTRVWDVPTGKQLLVLRDRYASAPVAFAPQGHTLASVDREGRVALWDYRSGRKRARFPGTGTDVRVLTFTPDGRALAWGLSTGVVQVWEVATAQKRFEFRAHEWAIVALAFSADGRWLGTSGYRYLTPGGRVIDEARLWHARMGREVRSFPRRVNLLALSPAGDRVATGGPGSEVVVWEAATGKALERFEGHRGALACGAFTPDGRRLVTGSGDTTALVWGLKGGQRAPAALPRAARPLPAEAMPALWADLASPDAARGYAALRKLAEAPREAVPLLRARLRPAAGVSAEKAAAWIAALGSDNYEARTAATQALTEHADEVEGALREALRRRPELEVRRRIEQVLATLERPTPARLRAMRALEVLEEVGDVEALAALARGSAQARLTREAKAALTRLARASGG
jgi:RNA polymerase sigma factor (sigma-70 family)